MLLPETQISLFCNTVSSCEFLNYDRTNRLVFYAFINDQRRHYLRSILIILQSVKCIKYFNSILRQGLPFLNHYQFMFCTQKERQNLFFFDLSGCFCSDSHYNHTISFRSYTGSFEACLFIYISCKKNISDMFEIL